MYTPGYYLKFDAYFLETNSISPPSLARVGTWPKAFLRSLAWGGGGLDLLLNFLDYFPFPSLHPRSAGFDSRDMGRLMDPSQTSIKKVSA